MIELAGRVLVLSMREFCADRGEVVREAASTPCLITRKGERAAYVISPELWDELIVLRQQAAAPGAP